MAKKKMPVLFVGHGSPMNAVADNAYTRSLSHLGKHLPKPKAILVVSAHWLTKGTYVSCNERPKTMHDFYGFPDELYSLQYPAKGSQKLAQKLADSSKGAISCATDWGLDHASWAVLRHIYPKADVPVFELSLDMEKPPEYHYEFAKRLAPLRDEGVLIIGSGNIVHNLWSIRTETGAPPYRWAKEFDEAVREKLLEGSHKPLINYENSGEAARLSIPTSDHYLPMLYAIALQGRNESASFFCEGIQNGSVSMRGFTIS